MAMRRFDQAGAGRRFIRAMKHLFIGVGLMVGCRAWRASPGFVMAVLGVRVGYVWAMVGFLSYRVNAFTI